MARKPTLVPGPGLRPLVALREFRRDPIGLLSRAAAYGDVTHLRLPRFDAYLLNHPDLVHEVLVTGNRDFMKGPTMQAAKLLLGESILTSEGEYHRRQRRLIQPIFHHERIAAYGTSMVEHALRATSGWTDGQTLDAHAEMARLTLSIVGATLFGTEVGSDEALAVTSALTDTLSMFDRVYSPFFQLLAWLPLPSTRRFERIKATLDSIVLAMIAERRAAGAGGDDLVSLLLVAEEDGAGMSDEQVRNEVLTLFLAGHETTANALTWTWWLLSRNPKAEARLHAELADVLAGRPPKVEDVSRLVYTESVLSESIRLCPPAWAIGRRALADHAAGGYVIPKEAVVVVSPYLLHHDPRWYAEPESFRPERWTPEEKATRPRGAFIPFGGGQRMCVGEPFAWQEAILLIATIAQRWRLRLVPGHPVEFQPAVTLRPKHGMAMTIERRDGVL